MSNLYDALQLAERLMGVPNAGPDGDLRTLARHLLREHAAYLQYRQALWTANGTLIQMGQDPIKLEYPKK